MAKLKLQKEKDLAELTEKLKAAKSYVMTGYRGTTVKDMDAFRNALRKEKVFSKVYKIPLVKKAMEAVGLSGATVDYKQPVILSISNEDETTAARVIKNLARDIKTFSIIEGVVDGKVLSKLEIIALADLPSKDQLRSQFMSVLNGPMSAFARLINAYAEKLGTPAVAVEASVAPIADTAPEAPIAAVPVAA